MTGSQPQDRSGRRAATVGAPGLALARPSLAQARIHRLDVLAPGRFSIEGVQRWTLPELARLGFAEGRNPIPIIFGATRDAIQDGLVQSLARPEANVTGQSFHTGELSAKRVQLLRDVFPQVGRFAVVFNVYHPSPIQIEEASRAQAALGIDLVFRGTAVPEGLDGAFGALKRDGVEALFVVSDVSTITNRVRLGEVALRHRMPMMLSNKRYLTGGGLMSYGPDISEGFRRAARRADELIE